MLWTAQGTRQATTIFEAAVFLCAVRPVCGCGHSSTFDPHGLWWLFERKRWDDRFSAAKGRFWCRSCAMGRRGKVRPKAIETQALGAGDLKLSPPDDRAWKKGVSRYRA